MESSATFDNKLKVLEKALVGFSKLINLPLSGLNEVHLDGIKNGQIQKFEYTIELLWKTARAFLSEIHGVPVRGPRDTFREMLSMNLISAEDCNMLLLMLDARNETSHEYEENILAQILPRMNHFLPVMNRVYDVLKGHK
jgi:nucleotidyltransferase substrate binding protein (TIGR01987 family)